MSKVEPSSAKGWDRQAVTFRLSSKRVKELRALCGDDQLSPTAALDLAIKLARENEELDNLPTEFSQIQNLLSIHARSNKELLTAMAKQIHELRSTIMTVANSDDNESQVDNSRPRAISMRAWLDRETQGLSRSTVLMKAQWHATRRANRDGVLIELAVQRIANTGSLSGRDLVHLHLDDAQVNVQLLSGLSPFYFRCQHDGQSTWQLSTHDITDDRKLGPILLILRI